MINRVTSLAPHAVKEPDATSKSAIDLSKSFSSFLGDALNKVEELESKASQMGQDFAAGNGPDIQDVLIAGQKKSLAIDLTLQVRNKVIEAYQEIMRMQL